MNTLQTENAQDGFNLSTRLRKLSEQEKHSFIATIGCQLVKFQNVNTQWSIEIRRDLQGHHVVSSYVLRNNSVLVIMNESFEFYAEDLILTRLIMLITVIAGLSTIQAFKKTAFETTSQFMMLAAVRDISKIEAQVQNKFLGDGLRENVMMATISVDYLMIYVQSEFLRSKSILLERTTAWFHTLLELS